jgi:phospholipase/carboxylesterase
MTGDGVIHVERPGRQPGLLTLHGTGADETQLLPLAAEVAPGHAALGVRGRVLEAGMPRYFRRLSMHEYDIDDLRVQAGDLADWLLARPGFQPMVVLGYSNGGNMGAALLLLRPETLAGAILMRANLPVEPDPMPRLDGRHVLLLNAAQDPYARPGDAERLLELLQAAGAEAELHVQPGGHDLTPADVEVARGWFARAYPASAGV